MADFQFSMMNNFDRWGWSYVFYGSAAGDDPNQALVIFDGDLLAKWQVCHNNYVSLKAIRAVNLSNPRQAITKEYEGVYGIAGAEAAHPGFAVRLGFTTFSGQKRVMAMRGMVETWPQIDGPTGNAELHPDAITAFNSWGAALVSHQFAMRRAIDQSTNPFVTITSINTSVDPVGRTLIGVATEVTLTPGSTVYIGKITDPRFCGLNGYWKVISQNGTFITIERALEVGPTYPVYPSSGHLRKIVKTLDVFTSRMIKGVTTRSTGRPFGLSRGRSSGGQCRR